MKPATDAVLLRHGRAPTTWSEAWLRSYHQCTQATREELREELRTLLKTHGIIAVGTQRFVRECVMVPRSFVRSFVRSLSSLFCSSLRVLTCE